MKQDFMMEKKEPFTAKAHQSILYISHYYPPEVNAPAIRVSQMAESWVKKGKQVTILTGFPNHPSGVIPSEYAGRFFMKETQNGVDIMRTYVYATPNKGFLKRIMNYLSFMFSALILGLPRLPRLDIVIATSPQFFVAIAGYLISVVKRIPFVFEVRDVWPEEIVAVGALQNKFIIGILERIEMFLYRRASLIVAVAKGTIDILTERGIAREKIVLLPNGINLDEFDVEVDMTRLRQKHNLNGEFLVTYIGTHGMAHKLQTVITAAEKLSSNQRIKFMMIGDGAEKQQLIRQAEELGLDNVTFVPQLPHDEVIEYYRMSDACMVPLRKAKLFTRNIPSKIYEIMASGRPILIGTEGESMELVTKANAGIAFEPENAESLVQNILKLCDDRELSKRLGRNGHEYATAHCSRNQIADKYLNHLQEFTG